MCCYCVTEKYWEMSDVCYCVTEKYWEMSDVCYCVREVLGDE